MSGRRDALVLLVAGMLLLATVAGEIVIAELRREHATEPAAIATDPCAPSPSGADPFASQQGCAPPAPVTHTRVS